MKFRSLLIVLLLTCNFASTEIKKHYDDFDGTLTIISNTGDGNLTRPFSHVLFQAIRHENKSTSFSIGMIRAEWGKYWTFAKNPLEVKVATKSNDIQKNEILTASNLSTSIDRNYLSSGLWGVSQDLKNKIMEADSIVIRVHSSNSPAATWTVPDKMLREWKSVVNMFEKEIMKD